MSTDDVAGLIVMKPSKSILFSWSESSSVFEAFKPKMSNICLPFLSWLSFFVNEIIFLKLCRHLNNRHSWGEKTIAQWRVQEERVRQMESQVDEYVIVLKQIRWSGYFSGNGYFNERHINTLPKNGHYESTWHLTYMTTDKPVQALKHKALF